MKRICSLTLCMNEGLVKISAEQRVRKISKKLLEKGRHVVRTLIGSDLCLATAIKVFSQLEKKMFLHVKKRNVLSYNLTTAGI